MSRPYGLCLLLFAGPACAPRLVEPSTATPPAESSASASEAPRWSTEFEGDIVLLRGPATFEVLQEAEPERMWPWASVTKQVIATMVMQQVEAGRLQLDAPASDHIDELGGVPPAPTVRQLLQHQSGLRDPDDSPPDADGIPSYYTDGPTGLGWCLKERTAPAAEEWAYNNCDYVVLGELLERATGRDLSTLFTETIAKPAALQSTSFIGDAPGSSDIDGHARLGRYGASGAIVGPLRDMLRFDAALVEGRLVSAEARDELWRGQPRLGFMALGQWSFEAKLQGCNEPVRIIERRGAIGAYQARNFILPEHGLAVALATQQPEFEFGEIWMGSGFSYELLSAVTCGD
ncbi:MAG: serine hydrolase domain-containing protein [Myxococcota bacterium]